MAKILFIAVAAYAAIVFLQSDETIEMSVGSSQQSGSVIIIPNQGSSLEGHTPRGFAGTGTGLFVGDNLNQGFPDGDGVQMFLTFDISGVSGREVSSVFLRARNATVKGTPFTDLGNLVVERISYEAFSKELWNRDAQGDVCILASSQQDVYECDVSSVVSDALAKGQKRVQFRVRFDVAGDNDGAQDMLFFYKTSPENSNKNESGIFELEVKIKGSENKVFKAEGANSIRVPVIAHLVKNSGAVSTTRNRAELELLLANSKEIWKQAGITLDVSIQETVLPKSVAAAVAVGNFEALYATLLPQDSAFNIFYVHDLLGPNGIAISPSIGLVADITTVDDFRATAHEIGHLLGLSHALQSESRLMFPGANGSNLSNEEIEKVWSQQAKVGIIR